MSGAVITYKCPNCDGGLVFDPESGSYSCEYCGSKFSQEELSSENEEKKRPEDAQGEAGEQEEEQQKQTAVAYRCPSCGAEIITDETTAATFCFYCHNPIVLEGKLEGSYLPDGIIPFKITKEEAIEKFHQWILKKKFLPAGFYSKRQIEKMSGIYFPYWLYDCETENSMSGTARDVRVWRVGDTEYTETKTYAIRRAGEVRFHHLPKTALQKAENAMLKGIFPYNFEEQKKFYMGFLSGFQAEKRDIENEALQEEIHRDIREFSEKRMRDTISGHHSFQMDAKHCEIREENFSYVLLPVWVLTYRERGNHVYYFAMNGQTGEIVGKLPVNWKKLLSLTAVIFLGVFALILLGGLVI